MRCQGDDYMKINSNTKEELLDDLNKYIEDSGVPQDSDFRLSNGLRSVGYYKKILQVKTLREIVEMCDVELDKDYIQMHYSRSKNLTNDELLAIMRDYNDNIGFPTTRGFKPSEGYPSGRMYIDRFGSFKNAIEQSGIEIPNDRMWLFERESLSDDDIRSQIKTFVNGFMVEHNKLPTYKEVDECKSVPSTAVISRRFGSLGNLLEGIGFDTEHNEKAFKQNLLDEYIRLSDKYGRLLTSRDLDRMSLTGESHSASSYGYHFGNMYNIQKLSNFDPIDISRDMSDDDMTKLLIKISKEEKRIPLQSDLNTREGYPSVSAYSRRFGSFYNALIESGFDKADIFYKRYITEGGVHCLSTYEYQFANMLEDKCIDFKPETNYKDYIDGFEPKYRFDYEIIYENIMYVVEIFGITGREDYKDRMNVKIKTCKENDLPLICLYPDDFLGKTIDEIYDILIKKIDEWKIH